MPCAAACLASSPGIRRGVITAALVVLATGPAGCIASRSGAAVFPARYDVAPVTMSRTDSGVAGFHMAGALSWASLSPNPANPIDLAVGYQLERYPRPDTLAEPAGSMPRDAAATLSETDGTAGHGGSSAGGDPGAGTSLHGPFLELGLRVAGNRHTRVWLSARGELLAQDVAGQTRSGLGAVLRLSGEIFATTKGSNAVGSIALGPFIELGARELPSGKTAAVALAGVSLRLPLVAVK